MSIDSKYSGKYFYHFTHIENLDSIIKYGLLSTNEKSTLSVTHKNIASESIQERRHSMNVPRDPKGTIHDYVPFYFCCTNPMFLSILNTKNIDQQFMIYLAVAIDKIEREDTLYTDASANTTILPNFYSDPKDLDKLDWGAINNTKWGTSDKDELHRRMAEVLIFNKVDINQIDAVVVWNRHIKDEVKKVFDKNNITLPNITTSPFNGKHFFFTKFMVSGMENHSLVTGPFILKATFVATIKNVNEKRKKLNNQGEFIFKDVKHALSEIDADFCVIKELEGIYELETINDVHSNNVSDHTKEVVGKVLESKYYELSNNTDKNILKLAAYLHDIGKGPKSKWKDGKQPAYPDHPADAAEMLERILVEDFEILSKYKTRMICLLVIYHDLIGEVIGKDRNFEQIVDVVKTEKEFDMLSCLNLADVSAIRFDWEIQYKAKVNEIRNNFLSRLNQQ